MIIIYRGDTPTIEVNVTDDDGVFDLTGWAATLTCKINKSTLATLFQSVIANIPNPEEGTILFELTSDNTDLTPREYVYDVQLTKDDKVHTILEGIIQIKEDITK